MNDTLVKICGCNSADAVEAAVDHGASHVGFVFFEPSPRDVRPKEVGKLAKLVPDGVKRVGVFVDPDDGLLERAILAAKLDVIQLHGEEKPDRLKAIKSRHKARIWKAIPVSTATDLEAAKKYAGMADRILFDARTPKASRIPGGMGIAFDWKLLQSYKHRDEWGLSGGLNPDNVAQAINITGAPLVDISSGVESEPGVKDPTLIASFLGAVKAA